MSTIKGVYLPYTEPADFAIQFNDNTPEVIESVIRVSFRSNAPIASAICSLSGNGGFSSACELFVVEGG